MISEKIHWKCCRRHFILLLVKKVGCWFSCWFRLMQTSWIFRFSKVISLEDPDRNLGAGHGWRWGFTVGMVVYMGVVNKNKPPCSEDQDQCCFLDGRPISKFPVRFFSNILYFMRRYKKVYVSRLLTDWLQT